MIDPFAVERRGSFLSEGERELSAVPAFASGDGERFWSQALQNLKSCIEAELAPPTGEPPPRTSA